MTSEIVNKFNDFLSICLNMNLLDRIRDYSNKNNNEVEMELIGDYIDIVAVEW
jgi:hypothetical protein